ncbi:T9SS type A sorting domain-containing protein [uncultured Mesonia sp.]|uniref:T9SS type A sorting domain-containing protein n=1 Tax=uncultured Mesonia sp. TaxID=399731 RepID=UPI00374E5B8A
MRPILFIFCFFMYGLISAQISVKGGDDNTESPTNYIYVEGGYLFSTGKLLLTRNSDTEIANIYLRNNAQFIQEDDVANEGNGTLSVFQEGAADQYAYNYWGAPVGLISNGNPVGNLSFGINELSTPNSRLKSSGVNIISGYNSTTTNTTPNNSTAVLNLAKYWIFKYINQSGNAYANWISVQDVNNIYPGEGFTMKGVDGTDNFTLYGVQNNPGSAQRYDFRGRPNNGDIQVTTFTSANDIALLGNPYPSAIFLSKFLIENSTGASPTDCNLSITRRNATTGVAYFWDSDPRVQSHNLRDYNGGYAAFSPNGSCIGGTYTNAVFYNYDASGNPIGSGNGTNSLDINRKFIPIAQGFFVQAPDTGTLEAIRFNNSHRVYQPEGKDNTNFDRQKTISSSSPTDSIPLLRLNFVFDNLYTRQVAVVFNDAATTGVDMAMDAANIDAVNSDAGIFNNNRNYVIDVRPFNQDEHIPLYISLNEDKEVTFKINNQEHIDLEHIYIYDSQYKMYNKINDGKYFNINLPAGNHHNRFYLAFKDQRLGIDELEGSNFIITQNNSLQTLNIGNPNNASITAVRVFDMMGKRILFKNQLGSNSNYSFSTQNLAAGIYIVQIVDENQNAFTQKVSIYNK